MMWGLQDKHAVIISPESILFVFLLGLGSYFIYQIRAIVMLLFLAFIIMTALHPWVDKLSRRFRIPRPFSIFLVYLTAISFFTLLLSLLLPPLGSELYQLIRTVNLPFLQEEATELRLTLSELGTLANQVSDSLGRVFSLITSTFSGVFTVFTLIIMSYYLMLERPRLHKKLAWFTRKAEHLQMAEEFLDDVEHQLGGWVRGQILLMLLIGVITFIGWSLLGLPYALPLALLAGLLGVLPNLGPTIAAVPAVIFAYLSGGWVLAGVAVLFSVVVQQLENNLIVPKIMQDNADVSPLVSIVAIITGLKLGGVMGALLAIPAYIVIRAFYSLWYRGKLNGI